MNEYDTYQVGDKLLFVEYPLKAAVEIVEKFYKESEKDLVWFKVRFTKIYRQFPHRVIEAGSEITVGINLTFTGWCGGMWRFLPLDDLREQASADRWNSYVQAQEAKGRTGEEP